MAAALAYASNQIAGLRVKAHQHLVAEAHAFVADPARKAEFSDPAIPAYLAHVLHKEGLIEFNRQLRSAIAKLRIGVNTGPCWALVDATGFWEDATPGRWAHMSPAGMKRLLLWAMSYKAGQLIMLEDQAA